MAWCPPNLQYRPFVANPRTPFPRMECHVSPTLPRTSPVRFWPHAVARLAELRVTESEVAAVLSRPLWTGPGGREHPPGRRVYVGGRIRVVTDSDGRVVTVGLQTDLPYVHGVHVLPTVAGTSTDPHRQHTTAA